MLTSLHKLLEILQDAACVLQPEHRMQSSSGADTINLQLSKVLT